MGSRHQCVFANMSRPWKARDEQPPAMQVLFENLPVALAGVDCQGTEAAITACQSNDNLIGECTNITSSTVLACANSAGSMWLAVCVHVKCPSVHDIVLAPDQPPLKMLRIVSGKAFLFSNRMTAVHVAPRPDIITD